MCSAVCLTDLSGKQAEAAACGSVILGRTGVNGLAEQACSQVLPLHAPKKTKACCDVGVLSRPALQHCRALQGVQGILPQQNS